MAQPWFLTLWCVLAAFGAYACMYGFRKPFTAAGFGGAEAYLLITVLRSIRADFAPEIWSGLGHGDQSAIFTQSELGSRWA